MTTDDEQLEKLKLWWQENGAFIVIGVALGLAALFGWRWWGDYKETAYTEASMHYERLLELTEAGAGLAEMEVILQELRSSRIDTGYADFAALELSRHATGIGEHAVAIRHLAAVVEHARDRHVAHIARIRLVRLHLSTGNHDDAERLLSFRETGAYAPLYGELRGDLALARGDRERAIEEYRLALTGAEDGIADRAILEMKLDDLGATRPGADT